MSMHKTGYRTSKNSYRLLFYALFILVCAFDPCPPAHGQVIDVNFQPPDVEARIRIASLSIHKWKQGDWDVYHLSGEVSIAQGNLRLTADEAVLWIDTPAAGGTTNLIVYLEGSACVEVGRSGPVHRTTGQSSDQFHDQSWFGRLRTVATQFENIVEEISPDNAPDIFHRGYQRRQQESQPVRPASYVEMQMSAQPQVISPITGQVQQASPSIAAPAPQDWQNPNVLSGAPLPVPARATPQVGSNAITDLQILPRNQSMGGNIKVQPGNLPNERILIGSGGARVNIVSRELGQISQFGQPKTNRLVIQADNVIAWENPAVYPDGSSGTRYEVYLEGNVIFAMGSRVIYADRMYYDANHKRGTILDADLLTPVPRYRGLVRLKADVVRQLDENQWQAYGAALTSSRLGVPRYWLQSDQVTLTREPQIGVDPASGIPLIDPSTGQPVASDDYFAETRNNLVYLGNIPVFYWPSLRTSLNNPSYYVERVRIGSDNVYGFQLGVGLDLFQLLGIRNSPANTEWIGILDYLSKRGLGFGSDFDYRARSLFGLSGQANGYMRSWFINDHGLDNLGRDRRMVPLEQEFRGRYLARHRHDFSAGHHFRGEFGWLSDVNFLQQYFEREWDQDKNYTTGLWLERNRGNQSYNLIADVRINDFFTQTNWLPRVDHYILGQPVLFDRLVWQAHSTASYAQFRTADSPTNPIDAAKFDPLGWEVADAQGVVAGTRHEIDLPLQIRAVKVVPYFLGDASYWQEDLAGDDLFRVYGQAGVRTSVPFWRVDPNVQSTLLNLNGLAHKLTWENELLYADASHGFERLPLYNQLDDDAQEFYRRRFAFDTFGILPGLNVPLRFDERSFAYRYGMQSYVTSPAMEIADDLTVVRSGVRNRWQTKRGLPGEARVIDWITLDVQGSWFPNASQDNFGADIGLLEYDFRWHIGDRLSLLSDGYFDFFSQGMRSASLGAYASRPGIGNLFVGFRTIEGPISSNFLNAAVTYRMSDKWVLVAGSSIDFSQAGNIGQTLSFIRVGESFLVRVGVRADASRGNVGFVFGVEPRFLANGRLGLVGGQRIPPASANYLE